MNLTNAEIELLTAAHRNGDFGDDQFAAEARCWQLENLPVGDDNFIPLMGGVSGRAYNIAKAVVRRYERTFK